MLTGKTLTIGIESTDTIDYLKGIIYGITGISLEELRVTLAGKLLETCRTLADYNIQKESILYAVTRLRHN